MRYTFDQREIISGFNQIDESLFQRNLRVVMMKIKIMKFENRDHVFLDFVGNILTMFEKEDFLTINTRYKTVNHQLLTIHC